MEKFLSEDFLLETPAAKKLYHDYAAGLPIIDYHSHIPPSDISQDRRFSNITNIWLDGDHYKWRAMRTLGIDEKYITGRAKDKEKFQKWAQVVPYTVRNPLYHWTHLELKNYFGIEKRLDTNSADEIYELCSEKLQQPDFSAKSLLHKMNVEVVCTTDDPLDTLGHHRQIKNDGFDIRVLPAFRPDKAYTFKEPEVYNTYLDNLEEITNTKITSLDGLLDALEKRVNYFHENGCRLSDHGLERLYYEPVEKQHVDIFFTTIREGKPLNQSQQKSLIYHILLQLGRMYHKRGWVQQFHLGALRNVSDRMYQKLGPDTGFDSIGDFTKSQDLGSFLNELDKTDQLPKTILYNVNSADNEVMATMAGNFNDGSTKGKIQHGTAWWYLDQKDGMEKQLNTLSNVGLLSCFIGMLTDSRSFLSYPRHEYFRRILCNLIGKDVETGVLPNDLSWLGKIVSDICYHNAKEYFNFQ